MKGPLKFIGLLLLICLLPACAGVARSAAQPIEQRTIRAVATTGMVGDVVRRVGGERLDLTTLMGAGVDPHLYKASEGDVIRLGEADIIFYSGLHLEAGMGRVLERIEEHGGRTVAVTQTIPRHLLETPAQFQGNYDPHVWFDVSLWAHTIPVVAQALSDLDPAHAAEYQQRAEAYAAELRHLDDELRRMAEALPASDRVLITAHDAFNYFGRAYGFEVRGLQGISTSSEAGAADVTALVDFIVQRRIRAIFVESSVPMRTVQAVQAAARARGWEVAIGGSLFSDAMGSPGTPEGVYPGMVRYNMRTIVQALKP